jgi:hypothetical protein
MITLHIDLPMPGRASRQLKYPFADLKEPGQCFVESDVIDAKKAAARISAAVGAYRRSLGEAAPKLSVRVFQQDGKDAIGVWRV